MCLVTQMLASTLTSVESYVSTLSHVVITARVHAINARRGKKATSSRQSTLSASKPAAVHTQHVVIPARSHVTAKPSVRSVQHHAKLGVVILNAARNATNLACHAPSRLAHPVVPTRGVLCPVQHLVTGCLARRGAKRS